MLAAALMLIQSASIPTLGELAALSPSSAGTLVLRGEPHGLVESVVEPNVIGLSLPYTVERHLVERPLFDGEGCVRTRWTVEFVGSPGKNINDARLSNKRRSLEIIKSLSPVFPAGQYVHLSTGLDSAAGFAALSQLEELRSGRRSVQFVCSDETSSKFCGTPTVICAALKKLTPWMLTREGSAILVTLGERGSAATIVRFDSIRPNIIGVSRSYPAPS